MTYKQEDMPFTKDGITPDIIMNPNAIPKRMTIAQFIECVFGKVGTIAGTEMDATPFRKVTVENISEVLEKLGYKGAGTEVLYNGKTGEQITANIFMGPTFYYRLKHLVEDKQHCMDYESEILTKNGWKKHNTLSMDDEIAILKNNELVYEKPLEIYNYPDNVSNMYCIKNSMIDMLVTENHRMYVSENTRNHDYKLEYAKDIVGKNRIYKNTVVWNEVDSGLDLKNINQENVWKLSREESAKYVQNTLNEDNKFYTVFESGANLLQQATVQAGWCVKIEKLKNDVFECSVYKSDYCDSEVWHEEELFIENMECPVWCVRVSSEVFLSRRNGKVVFTGNSRATGPYQLLTMQPAEGRSRDGGFRFGEMERDAMLSHGSVQFLKERTFDNSDKYIVYIDNETGTISPVNPDKSIYKSLYSNNSTRFSKLQIPYSSKLLVQELIAMHILPRLMVKDK